ncbi:MAG: DegT/DnrJ/EryC1/StrS family aminotransferase [Lachnospiraceae bacterium]|nr:DegT/DnrJ/EryC1/StrS family aminotransferase [Lachnospiraceae bacterium]
MNLKKLAIDGGTPVRTRPFPTNMIGAALTGEEELKELADVVREKSPFRFYGIGTPGKVAAAERELKTQIGTRYALAVSSGSAALQCAVAAAGWGPGDEVIVPAFSWYTDYCVLVNLGITPVFCDIGEDLNMDPEDAARKVTPKTKGIIPVHYQGCPAKMDRIMEIADEHGLTVIEDVAQALGGSYHGKKLGTFGKMAITSFQTHKVLTCGEGGMVFTDDELMFERLVRYHDLGSLRPFFAEQLEHPELAADERKFAGLQLRMGELQGAYLLAQARRLPYILETCRRHQKMLRDAFADCPLFQIRYEEGDCGFCFLVLFRDKETAKRFADAVTAEGIPCGPTSYCCNLVDQYPIKSRAMYNDLMAPFGPGCDAEHVTFASEKDCPHTNGIVDRFMAISAGPLYTDEDMEDIIRAVDKVVKAMAGNL